MTTKKNDEKKKADENPKILTTNEDKTLRVPLTDKELLEAGQKVADALQSLAGLEGEMQSFKEQMNGKVAEAEGKVQRYSALVRQKYEYRDVNCEVVKNYAKKLYTVTRLDTGEVVESRNMTNDELATLPMAVTSVTMNPKLDE